MLSRSEEDSMLGVFSRHTVIKQFNAESQRKNVRKHLEQLWDSLKDTDHPWFDVSEYQTFGTPYLSSHFVPYKFYDNFVVGYRRDDINNIRITYNYGEFIGGLTKAERDFIADDHYPAQMTNSSIYAIINDDDLESFNNSKVKNALNIEKDFEAISRMDGDSLSSAGYTEGGY